MSESWNNGVRGAQVLPLINMDAEIIRVEAGPGTGKTFGVERRVERTLHSDGLGLHGKDVLIVAFNRVIAKQLRRAIDVRLVNVPHRGEPVIMTVHALCLRVVGSELRIVLDHEREAMIYDVLEMFPVLRARYEKHRLAEQALREHEAHHADHPQLWQGVQVWLTRHQANLISDIPGLLLDRLSGGDFPNQTYAHVIVDEFQDLTPAEQELFFRLRRAEGQLVALGDPRQSIYRFRGNDPEGLAKLDQLAARFGGMVIDLPMTECHRCPEAVVRAANRLMGLSEASAMVPASEVAANLHVVVWDTPQDEARGMARAIVTNTRTHPGGSHLVMVTRRQFGYWLRDRMAALDSDIKVDLTFSESLLETWGVREAFLFFCLVTDPDRPSWRAWFAYRNSTTGSEYKASERNAEAYLQFLAACNDTITEERVKQLAAEPRNRRRGAHGTVLWDRAARFVQRRDELKWDPDDAESAIHLIFATDRWPQFEDAETARLDMQLLAKRTLELLSELQKRPNLGTPADQLRMIARQLRYQIATREPFAADETADVQVTTLWGAKGITADHVYVLGACQEAIPGQCRDEYPGTESDYVEEQRRLFYVSITRTKRTLVLSRAREIGRGEAKRLGLAIGANSPYTVILQMSQFLRDIVALLPHAVSGESWPGCA